MSYELIRAGMGKSNDAKLKIKKEELRIEERR